MSAVLENRLRKRGFVTGWMAPIVASYYKPMPEEEIWQWAEENVFLSEKMAATPGFYDSSLTPWARRVQEAAKDPAVRECVVAKSSQTGITEGALNILRWMPKHWPGNALYAINSDKEAAKVSKNRLGPSLIDAAGELVSDSKSDNATHLINLQNMMVAITGSGAAGPFQQSVYRVIVLDELESHEAGETTTIDRARSRFTTVDDSFLLAFSKVELESGIIWQEYLTGTREKFLVPCPHCGHRQELVWKQVRYEHCKDLAGEYDLERVQEETYYECASDQKCRIEEREKYAMVEQGEWEATVKAKVPGKISLHISDLYSNFPNVTWGKLAILFIEAYSKGGSVLKRKHFRTNHLGLPWVEEVEKIDNEEIDNLKKGSKLVPPYPCVFVDNGRIANGHLPIDPYYLSMCVDKQKAHLKYSVAAVSEAGEIYIVEYGRVFKEDELLDWKNKAYPIIGDRGVAYISGGLIDAGYKTYTVYDWCIANGHWLYPSFGMEEVKKRGIRAQREFRGGKEFIVYQYADHPLKSEVYLEKIAKAAEPRLYLPVDTELEFDLELMAEELVPKPLPSGHLVLKWALVGEANDWGDTLKMHYVMWDVVGPPAAS